MGLRSIGFICKLEKWNPRHAIPTVNIAATVNLWQPSYDAAKKHNAGPKDAAKIVDNSINCCLINSTILRIKST